MDNFRVPGQEIQANGIETGTTGTSRLPVKPSIWTKVKSFLFQEITVELTPKQQEFENKMNEFLGQKVTFNSFRKFLFQDVKFGK